MVGSVDGEGKIHVSGNGETGITIWYSNYVAAARVTSPMPNLADAKVFTSAARNNFIDDLVLKKLKTLRFPPSPICTDVEFIRGAYLDAAAILPTVEEARMFVADMAPDKR